MGKWKWKWQKDDGEDEDEPTASLFAPVNFHSQPPVDYRAPFESSAPIFSALPPQKFEVKRNNNNKNNNINTCRRILGGWRKKVGGPNGPLVPDDDDCRSDNDVAPSLFAGKSVAESIMSTRNSRGTISDKRSGNRGTERGVIIQKGWEPVHPKFKRSCGIIWRTISQLLSETLKFKRICNENAE